MKLAEWLQNDKRVSYVWYPGLKDHEYHELAKKYLTIIVWFNDSLWNKGGMAAGKQFVNSVELSSCWQM